MFNGVMKAKREMTRLALQLKKEQENKKREDEKKLKQLSTSITHNNSCFNSAGDRS
jgi:hypothetical protein